MAPNNKEVFFDQLPNRRVELCLVVMQELTQKQISHAMGLHQEQRYDHWKMVVFAREGDDAGGIAGSEKVRVVKGEGSQLRNIEVAVTRVCNPKGYAVLLNHGESFSNELVLASIATAVADRQVLGAAIDLQLGPILQPATPSCLSFSRSHDSVVNPDLPKL